MSYLLCSRGKSPDHDFIRKQVYVYMGKRAALKKHIDLGGSRSRTFKIIYYHILKKKNLKVFFKDFLLYKFITIILT